MNSTSRQVSWMRAARRRCASELRLLTVVALAFVVVFVAPVEAAEYIEDITLCRPRQTPGVYGNITSLTPQTFSNCLSLPMVELLGNNIEVSQISHRLLASYDDGRPDVVVMLLVERRRSVQYLEAVVEGDFARWDLERKTKKSFKMHSCLDAAQFCGISSVMVVPEGFWTIDRHRIQRFNYSWMPGEGQNERDMQEQLISSYGNFNVKAPPGTDDISFMFPTNMAEYRQLNATHITEDAEIDPSYPHAYELASKGISPYYVFVTDTGNHRLVMLDATNDREIKYVLQFGITAEKASGTKGFNWPIAVAVQAPGTYVTPQPPWDQGNIASVFVTDQMNNRVVKLNLIDTRYYGMYLQFSTDYGSQTEVASNYRGLSQPSGLALFRHYIIVCERMGTAITVLMVDYKNPNKINFVTQLQPQKGIQFSGSMVVTSAGYIWYLFIKDFAVYNVGTAFLPEPLRESVPPSRLQDLRANCVNWTSINWMLQNKTTFFRTMYDVMGAAGLQYKWPGWRSQDPLKPYTWVQDFNQTDAFGQGTGFNYELYNSSILGGQMRYCEEPPPPTSPPFMSGNEEGWQMAGVETAQTGAAQRIVAEFMPATVALMMMLMVLGAYVGE